MFHVKRSMDALGLMGVQAAVWGLRLCHDRRRHLQQYAWLLASYDRANVIGTRNVDRIMMDHVLDALSCFLHHAVDGLSLRGVEVANTRVEDLGRTRAHRGAYDVVTCRAVARLSVVAEYCVPLLETGGCAIAMKGRLEPEEHAEGEGAVDALGAKLTTTGVSTLPEVGEKVRHLVILQKIRETPARYPRRPGIVTKRPL